MTKTEPNFFVLLPLSICFTTYDVFPFVCIAGISPLTFNGSFSSVMYSVTDARDFSSLQFSIRTQSPAGLLLASASNSSHFMAIGLNGEKIEVVYRYWYMRTEDRLSGGERLLPYMQDEMQIELLPFPPPAVCQIIHLHVEICTHTQIYNSCNIAMLHSLF